MFWRDCIKLVVVVPFIACVIMTFYCGLHGFHCLYKAAEGRKQGVPFWTAFITNNVFFKPELYTPEGRVWAERYSWRFIGVGVFLVLTMGFGLLLKWLEQ